MKFYLFRTMRTCFLMQLVLLAVFFVSLPAVRADIITFQFEGELTEVDSSLQEIFSTGEGFTGSYTFDTASASFYFYDVPFGEFSNVISAMSFSSGTYNITTPANGIIRQDFIDEWDYRVDLQAISDFPVNGFVPDAMGLSWTASYIGGAFSFDSELFGPMTRPAFDPELPAYLQCYECNFYDADGNLVYGLNDDHEYIFDIDDPIQPLFLDSNGDDPVSSNGGFGFSVLDNEGLSLSIFGKLTSVTVASNIPSISIPSNKWIQIGLKTAPPVGSTVADIIGDDISAPYGSDWIIYSYQTSTNTYKQLSLTDTMLPGIGYWLIQVTGNPITIDMPDESIPVNVVQSPACSSFEGCFEIPLQTSNSIDNQWQMIGYPFRDTRSIDKIKVVTRDLGSDCFIGCTLKEANEKGLVSEPMYHFDGTSYQQLTTEGSEPFKPWDGAWIATLPAASGQHPSLLIPATN